MSDGPWDLLRRALAEPPGELAFRAACGLLDTWPGPDAAAAFAAAEQALAAWPDDCRVAPWTWCAAAINGERGRSWTLARTAREVAGRIGYVNFTLEDLTRVGVGDTFTGVVLNRYARLDGRDEGALLAAGRWRRLRHVWRLAPEDAGLEAFLASDLLPALESLQLILPNHPRSRSPVPGFVRPAGALRRLELVVTHFDKDLRPLLAAAFLPALTDLSLKGQYFEGPMPDVLRRMADEPVFAAIRGLCLDELHEAPVVALLTRPDVRPERLELRNRVYIPNLVERQQTACRLTAAGVAALARGGGLAAVTELSVVNERVGDAVLDLVAAAGRLRRLELVNVGLTDAGAARLAALPGLADVTDLDLQQNPLTARGVAALVDSPHLGRLRRLDLGSGHNNPYYGGGYCEAQAVGDAGVQALAASGLVAQLDALSLRFAQVGPAGVAALCGAAGPALRRLDLSANPLGAAGVLPLAAAGLTAGLRVLDLSICGLDDAAVAPLGRADLGRLRDLGLAYNSIGPAGAAHLASAAALANLWRLNLHDNFIGDAGLVALAGSPHLGQLVELDLEQDVWNYRAGPFGDAAAAAVAGSATFARLDTFFAGVVDEYHGGRYRRPFTPAGRDALPGAAGLRPATRSGLAALGPADDAEEPLEYAYHYHTPRQVEQDRRAHDFRGLPPLEPTMGEDQWRESVDPEWMLEALGPAADARKLRRFACACARRGLALAPLAHHAALVDTVERFLDGAATWADCEAAERATWAERPNDLDSPEDYVATAASNTVRTAAAEAAFFSARLAVEAGIARALRDRPGSVRGDDYLPEHHAQAALLRCLFRSPTSADPSPAAGPWLTPAVVALARGIDASRDLSALPALADALEEAGCTAADLLAHCRDPGPHARGCWALDLVLGRS